MKARTPVKTATAPVLAKTTATIKIGNKVRITHSQSVKQSMNYQSADATYGVELFVDDNDKSIKAGMQRAETLVEDLLLPKLDEHRKLLGSLG